jgi:hypothetical protein
MCHTQITIGGCGHTISSIVTRKCMQKLFPNTSVGRLFAVPHMPTSHVIHTQNKCGSCSAHSSKYLKR